MHKALVKKLLAYGFSLFSIFTAWYLYAKHIRAPLILPEPLEVLKIILVLVRSSDFWLNIGITVLRILIACIISIFSGVFFGFLSSISALIKAFLEFPVSIIRTTPVIAVILLALFWFSSDSVPVFVSVLMAFPVMYTAVEKGLSVNVSPETEKLCFMAKIYDFSRYEIYRYIRFPACKASFYSGIENCAGLCWKVTIAGEVLSLPKKSCGAMLQKAQVHLETAEVIAVTILLVCVSCLFQWGVRILCRKK